jgi:hypothetical protein
MNTLVIGLYTEGETDQRFLLNLIPRTLEQIIEERNGSLDIFPLFPIKVPKIGDRAKEIKMAAQSADGYTILIVLEQLPSYFKFKTNLTDALINLNYLR